MIVVLEGTEGSIFYVHVRPGASRNGIGGEHDGALKISTTAPPDGGKANKQVVRMLADALGIAKSRVNILSGWKNRRKKIAVSSMTREALERALGSF